MMIRLALLSAVCLAAAGCTSTGPGLGGTFASLQKEEAPARTCRNVAADAVTISARASMVAGVPSQGPRIGEAGVTEVAWPMPAPEADPVLAELMGRIHAEADASGCAIAFRDSLPPAAGEPVVITNVAPEPTIRPAAPRSAWNDPAPPGVSSVQGLSPGPTGAAMPSAQAPRPAAAPAAPPKPAPKAAERAPLRFTPAPEGAAPAARPPAKPVAVVIPPRTPVRAIPIVPADAPTN